MLSPASISIAPNASMSFLPMMFSKLCSSISNWCCPNSPVYWCACSACLNALLVKV
ncbi:Uncharacterised protein [Vibrio cholerae]|nr:Uncharacterised protein [Vibrio cholerae]